MILVILHHQEKNEYDRAGQLVSEAGTVGVSHGIDTETGKTIILPCDKWKHFQHNCVLYEGEWYLK
jgi:hypothetical protein